MKINVNGYNEILSYEGTPEELAEFVATGILFPYMGYEEDEECDCEEEVDESVIVPDAIDDDTVGTTSTSFIDTQKEKIREELASEGYTCSVEEFEDAYKIAVEIMGPLKELFR